MKHLITDIDGGFPLVLDDIRWLKSSYEDIAQMINYGLVGPNNPILYKPLSLSVSGTTTTVTDGILLLNNELLHVTPHSFDNSKTYKWFELSEVFEASGSKIFQDSSVHDTYMIRYVKIVSGNILPPSVVQYTGNEKTLVEMIKSRMGLDRSNTWVPLPSALYEVSDPAGPPMYCVDEFGFVRFKGAYTVTLPSSGNKLIGLLPFNLESEIHFHYVHGVPGTGTSFNIYVFRYLTTGQIRNTPSLFPPKINLANFPLVRMA